MRAQFLRCGSRLLSVFPTLFGSVTLALTAVVASSQTISVDKSSGPNGTYINVTGSGFNLNSGGAIYFNGEFAGRCPFGADIPYELWTNCTVTIRAKGPREILANTAATITWSNSIFESASVGFTLTPPLLTVRPSCVVPGTVVQVDGQGFAPDTQVDFSVEGTRLGVSPVIPSSGRFSASFTWPLWAATAGTREVWVADSTFTFARRGVRVADQGAPIGNVREAGGGLVQALSSCGPSRTLAAGDQIYYGETLVTGAGAYLEVLFVDDTKMVFDQNSKLAINDFVWDVSGGTERADSYFEYFQGLFVYTSGRVREGYRQIGAPAGAIGIRGTEFISIIDPTGAGDVHHLNVGKLAPTPLDRSLPPEYTGPVTIRTTATGSSATPLDPAFYASLKASIRAPLDVDGDGVFNSADRCPDTPAGAVVDANGCAATQLDADSDGVSDANDACPGTPSGASVDVRGCSASQRDSDADGVSDANDACPGTSVGASVDGRGCSADQRDSDGDGVVDSRDACPGTTAGTKVDVNGCAVTTAARSCDVNADGTIDYRDINLILRAVGQAASGTSDPRDADRDGRITLRDPAICTTKCDRWLCLPK